MDPLAPWRDPRGPTGSASPPHPRLGVCRGAANGVSCGKTQELLSGASLLSRVGGSLKDLCNFLSFVKYIRILSIGKGKWMMVVMRVMGMLFAWGTVVFVGLIGSLTKFLRVLENSPFFLFFLPPHTAT